jgi:hypothetical protein
MPTAQPTLDRLDLSRGAPMGRAEWGDTCPAGPVRLFRVVLIDGGYDRGGAYWGAGAPLYCATDCQDFRRFVRATGRQSAATMLRIKFPEIRFFC